MTEFNARDRELAEVLRETLERKAAQPDPLLDAALAATRARVVESRQACRHRSWWVAGGFALAASLAVVVVLPQQGMLTGGESPATELAVADMPDADLQFLESMDMLVAMK